MTQMNIGIIGDGAAAVILLGQIVATDNYPGISHIIIFAEKSRIGPGRAYRYDYDGALMNLPTTSLSLINQGVPEFKQWLSSHPLLANNLAPQITYAPRRIFGRFASHTFLYLVTRLRARDISVQVVYDRAADIELQQGHLVVASATGKKQQCDRLIISLGTSKPTPIPPLDHRHSQTIDPYPLIESMARIRKHDTVAIIGSALTSVDVAKALIETNHQESISVVCRTGNIPRVRNTKVFPCSVKSDIDDIKRQLSACDNLSIERAARIIRGKVIHRGLNFRTVLHHFFHASHPHDYLRYSIKNASSNDVTLDVLVKLLHPCIELIWNLFDERSKVLFLARYKSRFNALMNPIPLSTARTLARGIDERRLRFFSHLKTVHSVGGHYQLIFSSGCLRVNKVFNATPASNIAYGALDSNRSLYASILGHGLGHFDRFGGIEVNYNTGALPSDARIRVLGQATMGTNYITNSLQALRRQAKTIVRTLG